MWKYIGGPGNLMEIIISIKDYILLLLSDPAATLIIGLVFGVQCESTLWRNKAKSGDKMHTGGKTYSITEIM